MMKSLYKNIAYSLMSLCLVAGMASCSDFFEPETDDILDGDDYMLEQTEMYSGFLGIMTRMQAVGDKAIYLTETRGDLLEPTTYSTSELISIYNYDDDLSGNKYADPAAYYDVVIACNDYLENMDGFKKKYPELINDEYYEGLISSTLRIKVWAYLTIAEIYGQALWFDDPIAQIQDLNNTEKFELMNLDQIVDKCMDLLENGYKGVNGKITFSWYKWLDPDTPLGDSQYRYWDYMVPPYEGLYAKLALWKGAALQAAGNGDAAIPLYENVVDILVEAINEHMLTVSNQEWNRSQLSAPHNKYWASESPSKFQAVSVLLYDYTKNQTNSLMKHFNIQYPNNYLLRPSEVGRARFSDEDFNPGGSLGDGRAGVNFKRISSSTDEYYISMFVRSSQQPYQDDTYIYLFRADEYHFFIIEALNNLGRFVEAEALLNGGLTNYARSVGVNSVEAWEEYKTTSGLFPEFSSLWIGSLDGSHKYSNDGIRNVLGLTSRKFNVSASATSDIAKKANDCSIADEMMLEFAVEGKTYPALIRIAKRWNDWTIVSSRISPKYGARAPEIASKIEGGAYFVPWDLQITKK